MHISDYVQATSASSCWQVEMPLNLHACSYPLLQHEKQNRGKIAELPSIKIKAHQKHQGFAASTSIKKFTKIALVNFRNASAQSPRVAAKLSTFARQYQLFLLAGPFVSDSYWVLLLKMCSH